MLRHTLFKHDGEAIQCGFPVLNVFPPIPD